MRLKLSLSHSKVVQDAQVTIVDIYRHVFCVKETCSDVSSAIPLPLQIC